FCEAIPNRNGFSNRVRFRRTPLLLLGHVLGQQRFNDSGKIRSELASLRDEVLVQGQVDWSFASCGVEGRHMETSCAFYAHWYADVKTVTCMCACGSSASSPTLAASLPLLACGTQGQAFATPTQTGIDQPPRAIGRARNTLQDRDSLRPTRPRYAAARGARQSDPGCADKASAAPAMQSIRRSSRK